MTSIHKVLSNKVTEALLIKISDKVAAFRGLETYEMAEVFQFADKKVFNAGDPIVTEGKLGNYMYLIMDGEAVVSKRVGAGESIELRRLGPAESFGEMSIIDDEPRSASVTAATPCTILRLNAQALKIRPEIGMQVFRNIARSVVQKLRELEVQMKVINAEKTAGKGPELGAESDAKT